MRQAQNRRSPAMIMKQPARGVTTMGSSRPFSRMLCASSSSLRAEISLRGWSGLGKILSIAMTVIATPPRKTAPQAVIRRCAPFWKCSHILGYAALFKMPGAFADGLGLFEKPLLLTDVAHSGVGERGLVGLLSGVEVEEGPAFDLLGADDAEAFGADIIVAEAARQVVAGDRGLDEHHFRVAHQVAVQLAVVGDADEEVAVGGAPLS